MFLQRSAFAAARRAGACPIVKRSFASSVVRRDAKAAHPPPASPSNEGGKMVKLEDVRTENDLLPPGAKVGTVPTDMEQATGLERLEILGKMQGIDVFDMKPLDSSRTGTMDDPIIITTFGDEQYCGCTGCPADSHSVKWLTISRDRPLERCPECGSVYKMDYVGPEDDPHHPPTPDWHPKTFADYVKPEYRYR